MMLMASIILYSTGCPKCNVLKKKLEEKNIPYEEINDVDTMIDLDISSAPVLCINGEFMEFSDAVNWINNYNF